MRRSLLSDLRRRIWRERRRLVFVALCMFAAGYLGNLHPPDMSVLGYSRPLAFGLTYVLVFVPATLLLALIVPSCRFSAETAALAFLLFGIAGAQDAAYNLAALSEGKGIWVLLIGFVAMSYLYTGPLLDRWTVGSPRTRRTARSRLPAQVLWDGLVGTPPHLDRLATSDHTVAFDYLEPGKPHLRFVERQDRTSLLEEHQFVDEIDPPWFIRFRWHAVSADPELGYATGERQVRITDLGRKRRVDMVCAPRRLAIRLWAQTWLDDGMGRVLDDRVAELERRASDPAPPQSPFATVPS